MRGYLKKWPTQIADAHNRVKIKLSEKREAAEASAGAAAGDGKMATPQAAAAS